MISTGLAWQTQGGTSVWKGYQTQYSFVMTSIEKSPEQQHNDCFALVPAMRLRHAKSRQLKEERGKTQAQRNYTLQYRNAITMEGLLAHFVYSADRVLPRRDLRSIALFTMATVTTQSTKHYSLTRYRRRPLWCGSVVVFMAVTYES